ncbi:N-formylglutamate amidohydrolase [Agromyces aurantiacus]|uniref:N-formylglutamate amidohydrolase n=1 Tax=Agromyces aurantiacus TaxID=165814 RepID=A0ABV9R533_9MICO|nr:N-formylglutamate amidohydrolase [Agromyces aurantiacus]MBM7503131.1 hypothetical protein [Agromyces aurantiacus]
MDDSVPVLIPSGRVFTPDELIFYADRDGRTLDEAIADADLLVSCPHSGAAIPEELAAFLAPQFTHRLQYDFSDVSTSAIVRRWAELDPRVVYVENPHPRIVRDPNRARPDDLGAKLREAVARVRAAGPYQRVDLTGVDAIRPVTFSFFPLLVIPDEGEELDRMVAMFEEVAERGLGVYERTRDELRERFVAAKFAASRADGRPRRFTTLSFHDTMNHTTTRDGAVRVERDPKDRLPAIVALSNRGDHDGEPRDVDPPDPVTMRPDLVRELAAAHRLGFAAGSADDVQLNQPYLGSQEIIASGARFRELAGDADAAGVTLSAVQAEFLREFLLGERNAAVLARPGTGWVEPDPDHVDRIARACMASWDVFRESA